jgi:ATP/maltotriose-dependent transcriptional regulator MalT
MVAHLGLCLVHRAEILTLEGEWAGALEEARRVGVRFTRGVLNRRALGRARYREGEIHRLRGKHRAAEAAYREAIRHGLEPQPGLALLRLDEGDRDAAAAAIKRALGETTRRLGRAALLPALVEIALAAGDLDEARAACRELEATAAWQGSDALAAWSAHATGATALAEGDPEAALVALRRAWRLWHELGAPHEAARARVRVGLACRALGDEDTAALELEAAREAFAGLGAAPELARLDPLVAGGRAAAGLSPRELEVLRLVAAGRSNREIAAALVISEHTVARHVQNIFAKLGVSSRTAASAFAYEHHLV